MSFLSLCHDPALIQPANLSLHMVLPVWCAAAAYVALAVTAVIDARRGIVPDWVLLLASVVLVPAIIVGFTPLHATLRLGEALGFAALIWGANEAYYRIKTHDAVGMGDAKWSAVAILGFGLGPVLAAWGIGAWFALGWIGIARLRKRPAPHVYFAPFLLIGLSLALLFMTLC